MNAEVRGVADGTEGMRNYLASKGGPRDYCSVMPATAPSSGPCLGGVFPIGKPCKFVVADFATGNCSAVWRVWTGKNCDDVYIADVVSGGHWKASHHLAAGVARIAMTAEGATALGIERQVIARWAPSPSVEGWTEGVTVLVPCAYLRRPAEPVPKQILRVPTSPRHSGIAVRILFEEPGAPGLELPEAVLVSALRRHNGGQVHIVAQPAPLDSTQHEALAVLVASARNQATNVEDYPSDRFVGVVQTISQRVLVDLTIL